LVHNLTCFCASSRLASVPIDSNPIGPIEQLLKSPTDSVFVNEEPVDDDTWFTVSAKDLEDLLSNWQTESDDLSPHQEVNPEDPSTYFDQVLHRMNQFVNTTSEFAGIETLNRMVSDDDESTHNHGGISYGGSDGSEFDPDRFFDELCQQEGTVFLYEITRLIF
jgi:hypothetical protein